MSSIGIAEVVNVSKCEQVYKSRDEGFRKRTRTALRTSDDNPQSLTLFLARRSRRA